MTVRDLLIIGAGPAGLTAAVYARRSGLDVLVAEEAAFAGGQMRLSGEIENWPGAALISGESLSDLMRNQAASFGTVFEEARIEGLTLGEDGIKTASTGSGEIKARTVIIATGASHRHLDDKTHEKFYGRGLSYCAVCDGGFFRNQEVAVVGGGNSALESAMYLTAHASRVHLIHRRDQFRADKIVSDRLSAHPKVQTVLGHVVESVNGCDEVESVTVKDVKTSETRIIPVTGVFVLVGVTPNTAFLPSGIELVEGGFVKTDRFLQTSWPGVFAAGDVRDSELRQIVTAAADGALAATSAYRFIEGVLGIV
jgi:thioredoxin reductase (NADPH)